MPEELQHLVIKNFKGLSNRYNARLIAPDKASDIKGMFVSEKGGLSPIPLINSQSGAASSLSFSQITSYVPVTFSDGTKYNLLTDGEYFGKTVGDGVFSFIGYTTGTVTRVTTTLTGVGTAWDTNIAAGDQFKYDADSTWLNIASVDSATQITLSTSAGATSGAYTIRKKMSKAVRPKGVVLNDLAILCDGVRIADKWDGSSQVRITGMPFLRGLELHKRHIFGFNRDSIYWCDINTPTTWAGTNTEAIATKDSGDILAIKSYANMLVVFKSSQRIYLFIGDAPFDATTPTYSIIEADVPSNLGTIAPETVSIHNGLLRFVTNNGVYDFDGVSFTLVSRDVQTTINTIIFPSSAGSQTSTTSVDDTVAEFDAGTHSDTDYNETSSRLELDQAKLLDDFTDGDYTANPTWTVQVGSGFSVTANKLRKTSSAITLGTISTPSTNAYGEWQFAITLVTGSSSASQATRLYFCTSSTDYTTANGYYVHMSGGTAYNIIALYKITAGALTELARNTSVSYSTGVIRITRDISGNFIVYLDGTQVLAATDTSFTSSTHIIWYATSSSTSTAVVDIDNIKTSAISGTFISQVFDGSTSLVEWDTISVDSTLNGETLALAYRAEGVNPPVGAWTTTESGQTITTNKTNRYFQYRLIFTSSTKVGISPYVTSVTVNSTISQDTVNKPVAISFKDKWHLSYSVGGSINTDTLIQDEYGEWVKWQAETTTFGIFDNKLWAATSAALVTLWYDVVVGIGGERSWLGKNFDFDLPERLKHFDRLTIVFKFTSASCSLDYSIDEGSFVTNTVSLASTGSGDIPMRTIQIDRAGTFFQPRIVFSSADETSDFEIYAIILHLNVLELR